MINKENIWFTTLFSIILVLSIFYLNMNENNINELIDIEPETNDTTLVVEEIEELVALRIKNDEELSQEQQELQEILLSETSTIEEKNNAYEKLQQLTNNKGLETKLEEQIQKEYNFKSFIKINGNNITVVIKNKEHDYNIANKIIRSLQNNFKETKYITVKFN